MGFVYYVGWNILNVYMKRIWLIIYFMGIFYCPICSQITPPSKKSAEIEQLESMILTYARYIDRGEYNEAIIGLYESIEMSKKLNSGFHLGSSYELLAECYYYRGNYDKALELNQIALSVFEKNAKDAKYRGILRRISECHMNLCEYDKAISVIQDLFSVLNKQYLESAIDKDEYNNEYYSCFLVLSSCYYHKGDYNKSINILEELSEYEINHNDEFNETHVTAMKNLAFNCLKQGKLRDALFYCDKALKMSTVLFGKDSIKCTEIMYSLGHIYNCIGDRERARDLIEKSALIIKKNLGEYNSQYINALRLLSLTYIDLKKKREILEKIQDLIRYSGVEDLDTYVYTYKNLAYTYAALGDKNMFHEIEQRVQYNKKILNYFQLNKKVHVDYMQSIFDSYFRLGDYSNALNIGKQTLKIYKSLYGEDVTNYSLFILEMFFCYVSLKDTASAINILKETQVFDKMKSYLLSRIDLLPYQHRIKYWNSSYRDVFCNVIPVLAYSGEEEFFITQAFDNSALFAKGIMLNTEIQMFDLIKKYGNLSLKELYFSYLSNKSNIVSIYNEQKRDSVASLITNQEDLIWQTLDKQGLVARKDITWKDIQKTLGKNDLAIEFLSFHDSYNNKYDAALLLRKEYKFPKIVALGDCSKLKSYSNNNETDSLYRVVWQPIEKELKGIKNIYFSPAGQIYNYPIEYFMDNNGTYMFEKYNIFRLSSTKELLKKTDKRKYRKSVLYGGLDYDFDTLPMFQNDELVLQFNKLSMDRALLDSLSNRSGFEPLVNTSAEISDIFTLLSNSNIDCITYMGIDGIEESFKKLSGSFLDVIHLSTHGMYIANSSDTTYMNNKNLKFVDETLYVSPEDAALARSFLVMSKGNMLPKHYKIPQGMEDGILTAQEISNMDLKDVDLVVLSACQTALGDIDFDGVYGLQRGFKKAGANTILMSLDKVDDEATRLLMVEFYRNLMNGKSKYQSLKDAQQYLRQVDKGKYDKPEYWASFIMLDGLN